jgi:excisionase family DNA binding protein
MTVATRKAVPVLPKTHDINLAEIASIQMSSFLANDGKKDIRFSLCHSTSKDVVEFDLTPAVVELIFRTIVHIATGNAVTIVPFHAELTTQEAANLLNVSRPYLIKLLEEELIPVRRVGRHRRVLFEDILKYKEKSKKKSRKARKALTQEAQELDLGY